MPISYDKLPRSVLAYMLSAADDSLAFKVMASIAGMPDRPDLAHAELALATRSDMGALSIALYGYSPDAVRLAYTRGSPACLKAACLANPHMEASGGWGGTILTDDEAAGVLAHADPDCIRSIASNPGLDPRGLRDLLQRKGAAARYPDSELGVLVEGLLQNPSLDDLFDTRHLYPEGEARSQAAIALPQFARGLQVAQPEVIESYIRLLLRVRDGRAITVGFEGSDWFHVQLRAWNRAHKPELQPLFDQVRFTMALYCATREELRLLQGNHDLAMRAAYMAMVDISNTEDLDNLLDQEPEAYYYGVPYNPALYLDRTLGDAFAASCGLEFRAALVKYLDRAHEWEQRAGTFEPARRLDVDMALSSLVRKMTSHPTYIESAQHRAAAPPANFPQTTGEAAAPSAQPSANLVYWLLGTVGVLVLAVLVLLVVALVRGAL